MTTLVGKIDKLLTDFKKFNDNNKSLDTDPKYNKIFSELKKKKEDASAKLLAIKNVIS
jgi:hypothetical protein